MSGRAVTLALVVGAIGIGLVAFNVLQSDEAPGEAESVVAGSESVVGGAESPERTRMPPQASGGDRHGQIGETGAASPPAQPVPLPHSGPRAPASHAPQATSQTSPATEPADAERVFAAEAVDPAWAPSMEATLYEQIGEIAGSDLVTVNTECKTTLCRLQVTQRVPVQAGRAADESPAMYEMYEKLFARLGFESRAITSTSDGNGIVSSVVYLPRGDLESSPR